MSNLFTYSLRGNKVGDTGAQALAEGLQHCTNLQKLEWVICLCEHQVYVKPVRILGFTERVLIFINYKATQSRFADYRPHISIISNGRVVIVHYSLAVILLHLLQILKFCTLLHDNDFSNSILVDYDNLRIYFVWPNYYWAYTFNFVFIINLHMYLEIESHDFQIMS